MFRMSSVVKISGVARPIGSTRSSLLRQRPFQQAPWFSPARLPPNGSLAPSSLARSSRLASSEFFFNDLRQLIVAVVQLQNLDQLSVR
jgi:hypothetical protein